MTRVLRTKEFGYKGIRVEHISATVFREELIEANYKVEYNVPIELESRRSYILMSNHQSYYDIPLLYMTIPDKANLRMIAKKELSYIPLFGWAMAASNPIFIDRKKGQKAFEHKPLASWCCAYYV